MARRELKLIAMTAVLLGAAASVLGGSVAAAAPSLGSIRVSRSSGVAPLAVFFDATAASDPAFQREFHTLHYEWNFGDPGSQNWPISDLPRNRAIGAVAGHLFTEGGSYTVTVTITNPAGQSTTASTVIQVEGADQHAWSRTYCYANGASPDWTGCPAGATHVANQTSLNGALAGRMAPNTRHLFKRGHSFSLSPYGSSANGPVQIGAFGQGARPRLNASASGATVLLEMRSDWRVSGLDFRGTGGGVPIGQPEDSDYTVHNATAWDLNMAGVWSCIDFWNRTDDHPSGLAFVDITCRPSVDTAGQGRLIWHRSRDTMYLGLDIDASAASIPPMRTVLMQTTVFQHSRLISSRYGGLFTLRGCGKSSPGCAGDVRNRYNILSDNEFRDRSGTRSIRTCLQDACDAAGSLGNQAEHFIFERNYFTFDYSGSSENQLNSVFWLEGSDMTVRNNIVDMTGLPVAYGTTLVEVSPQGPTLGGTQANRSRHVVTHNTVVWDGPSHQVTLCANHADGNSHLCANNLVYNPGGSKVATSGGGWTSHANLRDGAEYSGYPFVTPHAQANGPEDFRLRSGVAPVNAGFDLASLTSDAVAVDFFAQCRNGTGRPDAGAHELGGVACAGGAPPLAPPAAPILLP